MNPLKVGCDVDDRRLDPWWLAIVLRPVVLAAVRVLLPVERVRPNHITGAALGLGLLCATAYSLGMLVAAALLFQGSYLLDCVDGQLARARRQTTFVGWFLDHGLMYVSRAGVAATWVYALQAQLDSRVLIAFWFFYSTSIHEIVLQEDLTPAPPARRGPLLRARLLPSTVELEAIAFTVLPIVVALRFHAAATVLLWLVTCGAFAHAAHMARKRFRLERLRRVEP